MTFSHLEKGSSAVVGDEKNMEEALYTVEFGSVGSSAFENAGVVVLETGRVFGGDSGYYFVGTYVVDHGQLSASIDVTKHNPAFRDAFGDNATRFQVTIIAPITNGEVLSGEMRRSNMPHITPLPVRLTKRVNLP